MRIYGAERARVRSPSAHLRSCSDGYRLSTAATSDFISSTIQSRNCATTARSGLSPGCTRRQSRIRGPHLVNRRHQRTLAQPMGHDIDVSERNALPVQ